MLLDITYHIYKLLLEGCGLEVKRGVRIFLRVCGLCPSYSTIIVGISYFCNYNSLVISSILFLTVHNVADIVVHSVFHVFTGHPGRRM